MAKLGTQRIGRKLGAHGLELCPLALDQPLRPRSQPLGARVISQPRAINGFAQAGIAA